MITPTIVSCTAVSSNKVWVEWTTSGTDVKYYDFLDEFGTPRRSSASPIRTKAALILPSGWSGSLRVQALNVDGVTTLTSDPVDVTVPDYVAPISGGASIPGRLPFGRHLASQFSDRDVILGNHNPGSFVAIRQGGAGATWSNFDLPDIPGFSLSIEDASIVLRTRSRIAILYEDYPAIKLAQYDLNGDPVTSVTYLGSTTFTSTASVAGDLLRLASGALVASWWTSLVPINMTFGYLAAGSSSWNIITGPTNLNNNGGFPGFYSAMAQHPSTGIVWQFMKNDGAPFLTAIRLTESGGALSVTQTILKFITTETSGSTVGNPLGPNGESPWLAAVANPVSGKILLAFVNDRLLADDNGAFIDTYLENYYDANVAFHTIGDWAGWAYGATLEFTNREYFSVVPIAADGSYPVFSNGHFNFIQLAIDQERLAAFDLAVDSGGRILLHYAPIDPTDFTRCRCQVSIYENGAWSAPINTGDDNQNNGKMIFLSSGAEVAVPAPDATIRVMSLGATQPPPHASAPVLHHLSSQFRQ